jgi:hypothetical protein
MKKEHAYVVKFGHLFPKSLSVTSWHQFISGSSLDHTGPSLLLSLREESKMLHRIFRLFFILIFVFGLVALQAPLSARAAGSWYVATTGNDNNDCLSPNTPCATINGAIGKAFSGDTIYVATGTYIGIGDEVVSIYKDITLSGGWDATFGTQSGLSTIDGQASRRGIAVNSNITATIERFAVQNGSSHSGGGISLSGGSLTLNRSTVSGNQQLGISADNSSLTLNSSTVRGNTNTTYGGGIYAYDSIVTINNSTISDNAAGSACCWSGGGIFLAGNLGVGIINNSTITGNTAGVGGGIEYGGGFGSVTLQNTVLAGNSAFMGPDCSGIPLTSAGYNIVGDTSGCGLAAGTGDQFNVDPLLSTYSIGEPAYHALQPSSPAIDAGNAATCLSMDQRGIARPQGNACDIGAYEYTAAGQPTSVFVVNGNHQRIAPNLPSPQTLEALVIDSQGSPVIGVAITFSAPASGPSGTFVDSGTNVTTVDTDNSGIALAPTFIANSQIGSYSVEATVSGVSSPASFTLSNFAWYVATNGASVNDCQSPTTPCLSISSVLERSDFIEDDTILVAAGAYSTANTGGWGVLLEKGARLLGGWDASFTTQNSSSTLDGQGDSRGMTVFDVTAYVERFVIKNGVGGGIVNAGTLTLYNSSVANSSGADGGGINNSGTLSINNSTVSSNHAAFEGGGIYNFGGSLILNNVTMAGNSSADRGGGLFNQSGLVVVRNSILARNTASNFGFDCLGAITTSDHNILGDTSGCTVTAGTGDQFNIDPQLGPFLPDQGYYALLPVSPAIDAGNPDTCPAIDQRGVIRPQGAACDIGAYEYTTPGPAASLSVVGGDHQSTATTLAFPQPLQVAALDDHGNPVGGVTIEFVAPGSGASGTFADTGNNTTTVNTVAGGVAATSIFTANDQAGAYTVSASATGLGSVEFHLINIASITGRVTDAVTGAPLPGNAPPFALVTLQRFCGDSCLEVVNSQNADSGGRFVFDSYFGGALPTGSYQIELSANLYQTKQFGPFEFSGVSLDVGDLPVGPVPFIGSISGRLVDAAIGKPVAQTFIPYVQLYRCTDGNCFERVNEQLPDSQGQFRFEIDFSGNPLPAGTYQIQAFADQFHQGQVGPFAVGEGEDYETGDMLLTSFPVRFSEIQPCTDIPATGGECAFSVRISNGLPTQFRGATWSLADGGLPDSFAGFTVFQVKDPQELNLGKGKSKVFRFQFKVPANNSPSTTGLCTHLFAGQGSNPLFNTVGSTTLFCIVRNAEGFSILSPEEAAALTRAEVTVDSTITETEPNNSCQTAQDIGAVSLPVVLDGNLDETLQPDIDFFRFSGAAGTLITIDHEGQATGKGTLENPLLGVFDSNCNFLGFNDDWQSLNSHLEMAIPEDGSLILAATAFPDFGFTGGGSGSYQMTVAPVQVISSIRGRVTDAISSVPLRGDEAPFAFVRLLQCEDFGCVEINVQATDSEGRFLFESDANGVPLPVGSYQVLASGDQYQPNQTDIFAVGEGENHDAGDIALTSFPVRFSDIQPCVVPTSGGVCDFSVKITNGLSVRLSGKAWSLVNGSGIGSFTDFTVFQTATPRELRLDAGKTGILRFRFRVGGSVADGATICTQVFVGQGKDAYFHTVGTAQLFCFTKGPGGFTLLSEREAQEAFRELQRTDSPRSSSKQNMK